MLIDFEDVQASGAADLISQAAGHYLSESSGCCRAYADWKEVSGAAKTLEERGVELVSLPGDLQARTDLALAVDAMELCLTGDEPPGTFVLVSGSAQLVPLVKKLKSCGCKVIGCGPKDTAKAFATCCDEFHSLDTPGTKPRQRDNSSRDRGARRGPRGRRR